MLGATTSNAQFIFHKKKKVNKSTAVDNNAQPDKILYDRAMDDIKHGRHEVGRLNMQTLINTYPDSEYLAKAKLAIADSYYKEGGTSNLALAISGYKDFEVFFPFLPEATYAQMQVAMAHYRQMEKPDRDRTQATRGGRRVSNLSGEIPERSAGATSETAPKGSAGSAGGRRLPDRILLLRERRQEGGRNKIAGGDEQIPAVQQVGQGALDDGRHIREERAQRSSGAVLRKDCEGLSVVRAWRQTPSRN